MCRQPARQRFLLRTGIPAALLFLSLPLSLARAQDPPGFALKWGGLGSLPGQFNVPVSLACDATGNVYVAEFNNHRVQKFTNNGTYITMWGSLGKGDGQLESPSGIAVDKSGEVYVVDSYNHRICRFSDSGTFLGSWGSIGSEPGQFTFPVAIALSPAGFVYVVEVTNCRVQKFTKDGTFIAMWGGPGNADGKFLSPAGITTDDLNRIYVVDSGNRRVEVFDSDGHFLYAFGSEGDGPGQFVYPIGIDIDQAQNLYVADAEGQRISKFTADGSFLVSWGAYGVGGGYFDGPFDVALDLSDNVFVADAYHHLVQKFDPRIPPPPPRPDYTAKLLFHLTEPVTKNQCENGRLARCSDARVSGGLSTPAGPFYFAYLLVSRGRISSVAGVQFGISYEHGAALDQSDGQGVDIFNWTLCADRQFPTPPGSPPGAPGWPGPGSGNLITWNYLNNCQFGDLAVGGYFYMGAYTPDQLRLTPRPVDNIAAVADCIPVGYDLAAGDLGFITFTAGGSVPGCNPCVMDCTAPTRVRPTTWSAIKALFH